MKLTLSKREQKVVLSVILLAAVIGIVYIMLIVGPLKRSLASLNAQVKSAREQVKTLEAAVTNEDALRKQYEEWDRKVSALRSHLPSQEELPATIEFLSDLAAQTQTKIQTIFPQRDEGEAAGKGSAAGKLGKSSGKDAKRPAGVEDASAVYKNVLVQIDAMGGFHQLGTFLGMVEMGNKPMQVSSLKILNNPKDPRRLFIKVVLRAYFATEGTAVTPLPSLRPTSAKPSTGAS